MPGYEAQSFPNTAHSVFYAYSISVGDGTPIGSFEKFGSSFTRTHERIREVLFNRGPITKEIIWGVTDIQITLTKVELYREAILQVFGLSTTVFSIEHFNQTVDIVETMYIPQKTDLSASGEPPSPMDGLQARVIVYEDCVPTNVSKNVDTGSPKVSEDMTLECRTVSGSYLGV
jgi:hypothetical protein